MSTEQQDAIVADAQQLWVAELPEAGLPETGDFFRWLLKAGSGDALVSSIARLGRKFAAESRAGIEMTSDDVGRYMTSLVKRVSEGKVTFAPNKTHIPPNRTNRNRVGIRRLDPRRPEGGNHA